MNLVEKLADRFRSPSRASKRGVAVKRYRELLLADDESPAAVDALAESMSTLSKTLADARVDRETLLRARDLAAVSGELEKLRAEAAEVETAIVRYKNANAPRYRVVPMGPGSSKQIYEWPGSEMESLVSRAQRVYADMAAAESAKAELARLRAAHPEILG